MHHQTFLEYRDFKYLKLAIWISLLAIIAYVLHQPAYGSSGGTWLGYTLGCLAAGLVLLLLWYGIRKRQYSGIGTLKGWLSAHVYLGVTLVIVATLHTGFQFDWNIHTLSYVLLLLVVINGFYGLYTYLYFPRMITESLGEGSMEDLLHKITELDELARLQVLQLSDEINTIVLDACQKTRVGGNIFQQLSGRQPNCPTALAVSQLRESVKYAKGSQSKMYRELYLILLQKETLLARARRVIKLKAYLDIWLYLHIPLAISMLVALIAHVVSTFFYG